MDGNGLVGFKRWEFVIASPQVLPSELESRLVSLVAARATSSKEVLVELSNFKRKFNYETLTDLNVVHFDSLTELDAKIQECFHSQKLVNRLFYHKIEGKPYKIRILYNPELTRLTTTRKVKDLLFYDKPLTLSWSKKYGIFTDQRVPKEFMDHLKSLVPATAWDWCLNFDVKNGSRVPFMDGNWGEFHLQMSECEFF